MFNKVNGNFNDVVVSTFKLGMPTEHGLRKFLTRNLSTVYANSWIELTSTRGLKRTKSKARERAKLSLRR